MNVRAREVDNLSLFREREQRASHALFCFLAIALPSSRPFRSRELPKQICARELEEQRGGESASQRERSVERWARGFGTNAAECQTQTMYEAIKGCVAKVVAYKNKQTKVLNSLGINRLVGRLLPLLPNDGGTACVELLAHELVHVAGEEHVSAGGARRKEGERTNVEDKTRRSSSNEAVTPAWTRAGKRARWSPSHSRGGVAAGQKDRISF